MSVTLNELPFIDIYVRIDQPDQAYYRSQDREKDTISMLVPPEFSECIGRFMIDVSQKLDGRDEGAITFEGLRFRVSRLSFSNGSSWFCGRRINTVVPDIQALNLPPLIVNHMMGLGKRDGLIIISGATGQGKTTTAVALLGYYLRTYGGTAITVEDPCEYTMAGRHGDGGQCFQMEAEKDEDWAICLKRSLRWSPRYIYVGEIRTPKAAEQVLSAAATGHLVITTMHASTMEEALMSIIFLAEQSMGAGVYNMLATAFTALVNQSLKESAPRLKYLFAEESNIVDPIRSLIRENKIGMLSTYIDRAEARLKTSAPVQPFGMKKP